MPTRLLPSAIMRRRQCGAIVVEFTLVVILMMVMLAGVIGFGRVFWYADALAKATRDGARLMSTWPNATINSAGVGAAQTLVVTTANAANVSPRLADTNVVVECLDAAFAVVPCVDGTAPVNVRVSVTGFSVAIAGLFPFIGPASILKNASAALSPHTTMPYIM